MEVFYIAFLTLIAATVGTIAGFGMSTIMIPVLVIFFPPVETIFLVAIIHWFGDVWNIVLFRKGFNWRLLILFGVVGLVASYFGALLSLDASEQILLRFLGLFLAGYAIFLLCTSRFRIPTGNGMAIFGGALSGFFAGMFGMGGAIRSMFLSAFDLPKAIFIATVGAIGLLVDSTRIITYIAHGETLPRTVWYGLFLFIPISFVGANIAKRIIDRIPQKKFRIVIAVFLLAVGMKLIFLP